MADPPIAFWARGLEPPGLEIRVNFGLLAGRAATSAELEELAARLVPEVGDVSVVAEERHEVGAETAAALHQVRIDVAPDRIPEDEDELQRLCDRLVRIAEAWARVSAAARHADVTEP